MATATKEIRAEFADKVVKTMSDKNLSANNIENSLAVIELWLELYGSQLGSFNTVKCRNEHHEILMLQKRLEGVKKQLKVAGYPTLTITKLNKLIRTVDSVEATLDVLSSPSIRKELKRVKNAIDKGLKIKTTPWVPSIK